MKTIFYSLLLLSLCGCTVLKTTPSSFTKSCCLEFSISLEISYDTIKTWGTDKYDLEKWAMINYKIKNKSLKPVIFNSLAISLNYRGSGETADGGIRPDSNFFYINHDYHGDHYKHLWLEQCGVREEYYPFYRPSRKDTLAHILKILPGDSILVPLYYFGCKDDGMHEPGYSRPRLHYILGNNRYYEVQLIYDNRFYKQNYDSLWVGRLVSNTISF